MSDSPYKPPETTSYQTPDPDAVSEVLDLAPTQTWHRGEHKRLERPDGTVRQFDSIHEFGGWKCSL